MEERISRLVVVWGEGDHDAFREERISRWVVVWGEGDQDAFREERISRLVVRGEGVKIPLGRRRFLG